MSQTFVSLDINAPVEAVFAALANIETFPDRAEAIAAVEFLSDQKHGVGTRFRETRIMNGREAVAELEVTEQVENCLLYTSPSPRDLSTSRMPSSA